MPNSFKVGVVIPVGPGRHENLIEVLRSLFRMHDHPEMVMLVFDGPEAAPPRHVLKIDRSAFPDPMPVHTVITQAKHEPGMEQPRNVGVRLLPEEITHVWFLDSDVIVGHNTFHEYTMAWTMDHRDRILIGPYDWLPPGTRDFGEFNEADFRNDPRWPSFNEHSPSYVSTEKLNDGLACFSGNLIWPRSEFERVGGFWNEIHHGRCEDGELGLRAVSEGVPISFVPNARGWHLWHPVNHELAVQRNARDVPMLNARHPWVQEGGLVMVEQDGMRFDQLCPHCGTQVNTIEYWQHEAACRG